jgi:pimeloyl-ACP methyl ester carboxylesterase
MYAVAEQLQPVSRRLALGTGLTYHVLEWGQADAALTHTVVLVHGFLDYAYTWVDTVAAGLGGRYHVVAPDLRGHGDSDRVGPGGYYHFMDYVADLHEVIGQLGRQKVSLVGHSMGGSVVGYYAGTYPERVHRLAMLEGLGPPEPESPWPDRVRAWLGAWARVRALPPRRYRSLEEAALRLRKTDPRLPPELALRLAAHGTVGDEASGYAFKHDPLHNTPGPYPFSVATAAQFWQRVTCPVLLVDATESDFHLAPDESARRIAAFTGAASVQQAHVDGAGHMMQRHQPQALAALLDGFLSG